MDIMTSLAVLLLFLHSSSLTAYSQSENSRCSRQDYDQCVKMADPLLKDPHLIFPDNRADIDIVCRRWSQFVDCVKRYTDRCFSESRRQEFNKAVESPVDSVHQMCTVTKYQTEYLKHASCIKSTLTREDHCGRHYKYLVDQVSGEGNRVSLCCSHLRFRECVLEETKRQCDSGTNGGSATRFSRQMLDKALSFLRDQCYNYIGLCQPRICPTTGECPGLSILSNPYEGQDESTSNGNNVPDQQHRPSNHQPYSPHVTNRPWQPQGTGSDRRGTNSPESEGGSRWMPGHRTTLPRDNWTPESSSSKTPSYDTAQTNDNKPMWTSGQPSDSIGRSSHIPSEMTSPIQSTSTYPTIGQVPNRPSSYGRGITWTPSSNTQTSSSEFGSNSWQVTSNGATSHSQQTTETWTPAVSNYGGNYGGNAVDEPNQQGLSNNNTATRTIIVSKVVLMLILMLKFVVV